MQRVGLEIVVMPQISACDDAGLAGSPAAASIFAGVN
jgi:hypothetical protein